MAYISQKLYIGLDRNGDHDMKSNERTVLITGAGLRALEQNPFTRAETILLWHLAKHLPVTGDAVSHVAIGKATAIGNIKVGKAMRLFCEAGFLIKGPRIGINYHYKLNPLFLRIL